MAVLNFIQPSAEAVRNRESEKLFDQFDVRKKEEE